MGGTLALVSCTKRKLPIESPAEKLYGASPRFRLTYEFARRYADAIIILSAKHGAVRPTELLKPYEFTLKGQSQARKREWATATHATLVKMPEYKNAVHVLWLAGHDYYGELSRLVDKDGKQPQFPLAHMSQGEQLQWLKQQLTKGA